MGVRLTLAAAMLCTQLSSLLLAEEPRTIADTLAACQRELSAPQRASLCSAIADNSNVPDDVRTEALLHKATALSELGDDVRAIATLTEAIKLNTIYPALYTARAAALVRRKSFEAALQDLSRCLALDPKNAEALNARGAVHLILGHADDALADFQALLFLDPGDAQSYAARGMALEAKSERARARADYKKALELDGSNETAARGLARLKAHS